MERQREKERVSNPCACDLLAGVPNITGFSNIQRTTLILKKVGMLGKM